MTGYDRDLVLTTDNHSALLDLSRHKYKRIINYMQFKVRASCIIKSNLYLLSSQVLYSYNTTLAYLKKNLEQPWEVESRSQLALNA